MLKTSSDEHIFWEGTKTVKNKVVPFFCILLPSNLTDLLIHLFNKYFNDILIFQTEIWYIKCYTYKVIQVVTQNIGLKSIRESNDKTEFGVLRTNKNKRN